MTWEQNLKMPEQSLQTNFTGCHQVQFQKNLMKIFIENFKNVEFGTKNVICVI